MRISVVSVVALMSTTFAVTATDGASSKQQLFLPDAFKFNFDDVDTADLTTQHAEGADEADAVGTGVETARTLMSSSRTAASLTVVDNAWDSCWGAGTAFLAIGSKDDWPAHRQRHRACVERALKRLQATTSHHHTKRASGSALRRGAHAESDESDG